MRDDLAKSGSQIRRQLSRQIDQLNREIEALNQRARKAMRRSQQEYLERLEAFERRVMRLRWRLMRARGGANRSWQAMWAEAEASLKEVRTQVAKSSAALRHEQRDKDSESEESSPPE
jgi:hypothetical protein